ncbi:MULTISPECIES: hypothetical protein [unclassified Microcoleus]|uniref:hypothetical protein n=1 Tax=unclassified Microcoleus TaxID=2642155 RepID=UPI002FD2A867
MIANLRQRQFILTVLTNAATLMSLQPHLKAGDKRTQFLIFHINMRKHLLKYKYLLLDILKQNGFVVRTLVRINEGLAFLTTNLGTIF